MPYTHIFNNHCDGLTNGVSLYSISFLEPEEVGHQIVLVTPEDVIFPYKKASFVMLFSLFP